MSESAQVIGIDPGVTTGICIVDLDARWLAGQGVADWQGLGAAIELVHHEQIGRHAKQWDFDKGKTFNVEEKYRPKPRAAEQVLRLKNAKLKKANRTTEPSPGSLRAILDGEGLYGGGELMYLTPDEIKQVMRIQETLEMWPEAAIVIEDFIVRKPNQSREFLSPVRMASMITFSELTVGSRGRTPFMQSSSLAMTTATDERLRMCGLYRAGLIHGNDAARHVSTFLRECRKDQDTRAAAFPHLFKAK